MQSKDKMPLTPSQALQRLSAQCSRREICSHDAREKLYRWGLPVEEHEEIVTWLVDNGFIDDLRYARSFVEEKTNINRWGRRKVESALRQKNIDVRTVADIFDNMDHGHTLSALSALLKEKRRTVKAKNDFELNGKLIRYALSRGFEWDDIRRCLSDAGDMDADYTEY